MQAPGMRSPRCIAIDPVEPGNIYVGDNFLGATLLRSHDGADTWDDHVVIDSQPGRGIGRIGGASRRPRCYLSYTVMGTL